MSSPTKGKHSLILIRGLPGAGKSTLAKILSENGKYPVHAIDHYFTNERTGDYSFDFSKNHMAYKNCEQMTSDRMKNGFEKILIDNTFTMEWEMEPYFKMAKEVGYQVFVITVENRHGSGNMHQISQEQLEKMAAKFKVRLM